MYLHAIEKQLRHLQMVGGLHGDADVADQVVNLLFSTLTQLVAVYDFPVSLVRDKEALPIVGDEPTQPLPHIQQINLRPQVDERVGRGRAGQTDHPAAHGPHLFERPEPLRFGGLE